jgi:ankyrin repeat protein
VIAAYGGHTAVVRRLLARGGFDEESRARALELASVEGHAETVSLLLAAGAPSRDEALLSASRRGRIDALRLLLDAADPAIDGHLIETALEEAAFCGRGDVVDVLLRHAPESAPLENILRSAVVGAGMFRRELLRGFVTGGEPHGAVVRSLLRARLVSHRAQTQGRPVGASDLTPLLAIAVEAGNRHVVSALLDYGADPNLVPEDGMPPLMVAVQARDSALVNLLLEAGARAKVEWLAWIDRVTLLPFLPQLSEALDIEDTRLAEAYSWAEGEGYTDLAILLERRLHPGGKPPRGV